MARLQLAGLDSAADKRPARTVSHAPDQRSRPPDKYWVPRREVKRNASDVRPGITTRITDWMS